ncbi:hypothetical protein B9Z55_021704 [Caenorhabditis nigoni]|uniref:Uncharacterized protein n=1 Tax=Caenorhabditis nigoni TaxID=1611254 RepID=A0A2G5TT47_9PELO|nr:hypothetical protein B9Z55_021704 [Caenorhabditis nigoni]
MGLEMFSLHTKVMNGMEGRMHESNMRILVGLGVAVVYLFVGAIVFVRIEYPLEKIERETYLEYQNQWRQRLLQLDIDGEPGDRIYWDFL